MAIRVLLVDDQLLFRSALSAFLATMPELQIVGEADDGEAALRLADEVTPDVAVIDARLPGIDGIETTRRIRQAHPAVAVLMLTGFADERTQLEATRAGAAKLIDKGAGLGTLLPEIKAAARAAGTAA